MTDGAGGVQNLFGNAYQTFCAFFSRAGLMVWSAGARSMERPGVRPVGPLGGLRMHRRLSTPRALLARLVPRLAVAAVLTASVAVAGCGSASSAGTAGSGSTSAANQQDTARVKLQTCLRKQGVNVLGTGGGGGGGAQLSDADRQKLQTALQGPCKSLQSQAFGNISDSQRQQFQDAFAKFSACMRQHGVDVPAPTAGSGGGPPAGGNQIDQSDPKVKAATTACQDKLPQGGPGGGPGGTNN